MNLQTRRSTARGLLIVLSLFLSFGFLDIAAANSPALATAAEIGRNDCRGMDSKQAHAHADLAFRRAQYREAGQCYLVAGDKPRADLALIKAAAAAAPATKRQLAANASQVKAQFQQLREAFTSH